MGDRSYGVGIDLDILKGYSNGPGEQNNCNRKGLNTKKQKGQQMTAEGATATFGSRNVGALGPPEGYGGVTNKQRCYITRPWAEGPANVEYIFFLLSLDSSKPAINYTLIRATGNYHR